MNENDVTRLLEKYDAGDTSLEEEELIYHHMLDNPTHWRAAWFLAKSEFRHEKSTLSDVMLRQRWMAAVPWYQRTSFRIAASLLLICVATVWFFVNQNDEYISVSSGNVVKQLELPDGSVVTLNQNTSVRYATDLADVRDFYLDNGEAFFEVVSDPDRPFTVYTGETVVQVLGTSFNVDNTEEFTQVSVFTGNVAFSSVANDSASLKLARGMAGVYRSQTVELKQLDWFDENKIAWKTHRLEFKDVPLSSVVKTLEDYFHITIETPDATLLACRFRGVFEEAKLEEIVQVMDYSLNVKLTSNGSVYTLSGDGCKL